MTNLQLSTDQRHAATLDFLAEVRDYLRRWPPHALNREMLKRIDDHLAEPTHKLVQSHIASRSGAAYTPVGQCLAHIQVAGDTATVTMATGKYAAPQETIIEALKHGLAFELHSEGSDRAKQEKAMEAARATYWK